MEKVINFILSVKKYSFHKAIAIHSEVEGDAK